VSWGTFFRYFPRKEDVLLEMGVQHYRAIESRRDGRPRELEGTAHDAIYDLFKALLTSDWPSHLHGAMLREISSVPVRFAAVLHEDQAPWVEVVAELLTLGRERGEVRDDVDALTLAAVLTAAVLFPAIQGGFEDLRSLFELPGRGDPIAILDRTFPIAWRCVEA
jgi:AcrR family transcriptional regulator